MRKAIIRGSAITILLVLFLAVFPLVAYGSEGNTTKDSAYQIWIGRTYEDKLSKDENDRWYRFSNFAHGLEFEHQASKASGWKLTLYGDSLGRLHELNSWVVENGDGGKLNAYFDLGIEISRDYNPFYIKVSPIDSTVPTARYNLKVIGGPGIANWLRYAGPTRYDTMAEIVKSGWSKENGGTVVVATGTGFKDALSAAGFAGLDDAPVILSDGARLSSKAKEVLQLLRPAKVYIAGGPVAISDGVLSEIQSLVGVMPIRVMGATSSGTSAALALAGKAQWADKTAIIATNKSFKDALSSAPVAYAKHWPILLADDGKVLSAEVLSALDACGIRFAYIVGGELAVTPGVILQLESCGITVKQRLSGQTGVATSLAIAEWAVDNGLSPWAMGFATSQNFPDALAGAALCGKNDSVLLLADDKAPANISFAKQYKCDIGYGYVFGGETVFSESLFNRLPFGDPVYYV